MKLHHHPRTRSSRVLWLLEELGVPHEIALVDLPGGEQRKPEYRRVHPHGVVPALEMDGEVLIESAAICMYLADRYADAKLAPPVGDPQRRKYYEWMVYVPATADPVCETVTLHTMLLPEAQRLPQLVEQARATWSTKIEPHYAAALSRSRFVLGDAFTAADVLVGSSLLWARMIGLLSADPDVARYLADVTSRPAFAKAHA